ncbi:MAG: glutamine--tRNA ligase, partial [Duncaniella sp.]|nr:glutamine--tRNA ligase [Duncaniella sp.]
TLHWVSAGHAVDATVRLYDRLFSVENPAAEPDRDFRDMLNPDSLRVVDHVKVEPYLVEIAKPGLPLQFQRIGYFTLDPDSTPEHPVFNRTIALKDTWEKVSKK